MEYKLCCGYVSLRLKTQNMEEAMKILKKLVSEGYKLKAQHNNDKWRKALEDAEELIIKHKTK
jgi:histidyl-tRNA synthetase